MGQQRVLAGRYRLISPLGRGGMGEVWEGRDERLGRPVAVKLLTADVPGAPGERDNRVRRFTREASVTASLHHPGVPAVYDAGGYEGGLYLVMELVDGCTAGDLIAEHGALPVPWVAAIGAQVAAVLAAAHEHGIVHRDIKPQNVMLTWDGTAKVLDFGVAGILSQRITSTGVAVGTPAYMAPEQLQNLPATPSTDLYTLGCLLYEMLSGTPVFAATSPAGLMRKHLEEAPAPLGRTGLDPGLEALVRQLLEKDPARRPADARETYDRLLPYVGRPGPLGDVDPALGSRSGQRLYSVLVARLAGGGLPPAAPFPPPAHAAFPAPPPGPAPPATAVLPPPWASRGAGWTIVHSLWVLPALVFGLGTWLSFGYIAVRHRRRSWLITAGFYLVAEVTGFVLIGGGPVNGPDTTAANIGGLLLIVLWLGGFAHAVWVNVAERLTLRGQAAPRAQAR